MDKIDRMIRDLGSAEREVVSQAEEDLLEISLDSPEETVDCLLKALNEESAPIDNIISVLVDISYNSDDDGIVDYLRKALNEKSAPRDYIIKVFEMVDTPYVCWLSDDNVVVNGGLDNALKILTRDPKIGMVALKIKDIQGPFIEAPYIGGISSIGILIIMAIL